jgi:Skp family chaperone for outer membrane proteins
MLRRNTMKIRFIGWVFWWFFVPGFACAQVYMWVDETGIKHYSNVAPADTQTLVQQKEEVEFDPEKAAYYEAIRKEREQQDADERRLEEEKIKQAEIAAKERREKKEGENKVTELERKVEKVETDLEREKEENKKEIERLKDRSGRAARHHREDEYERRKAHSGIAGMDTGSVEYEVTPGGGVKIKPAEPVDAIKRGSSNACGKKSGSFPAKIPVKAIEKDSLTKEDTPQPDQKK